MVIGGSMENIYRGADAIADNELICDAQRGIYDCLTEIFTHVKVKRGDILVVGCSSSEVIGSHIGKGSSYDTAKALFEIIYPELEERGIFMAAQCCEHLNRALVIERECAEKYGYDVVSVVPQPKAGGSFATVAYESMKNPVVVEHIKAHVGIDIGDTLIGMHLRDVAVPLRVSVKRIGHANLVCAYTRPKFIGGSRAVYQ